jgi:transcriptional regulator with XRE-family HTH domain
MQISLKACRVNANLKQTDLAKLLSVCPDTIKNWESGKTSPSSVQLQKISNITQIPMEFIFLPQTLPKVEK